MKIFTSVLLLMVVVFAQACKKDFKNTKEVAKDKNVLLILVDDLSDAVGCYGHSLVQTPNIDKLAEQGMVFDKAYVNHPMCGPSRASFLTGLRPETIGVLDNTTTLKSVLGTKITLPNLFKNNGYYTAGIGKVFHLPNEDYNDLQSWDYYKNFKPTEIGQQGESRNLTDGILPWCEWKTTEGGDEDQSDGQVAQKAVEIINQKRNKPFFIAVGFQKPHDPFWAPKKYFDMYPLEDCRPPQVPVDYKTPNPRTFPVSYRKEFLKWDGNDKREFLKAYYACITFMDAQVGKVLKALEQSGQAENTLVVLMSDHGYHLGEHNFIGKFTLLERSLRAPFIVAGNAVKQKGNRTNAMMEFVDIYPTLGDIMGLENMPDYLEGRSLKQVLENPDEEFRTEVRAIVDRNNERNEKMYGRMVKNHKWRYVEWDNGKQGNELYDQINDPMEYHNLSSDPDRVEIIADLRKLLYK